MIVKLLDQHNELIGTYPPDKARLLATAPRSRDAVEELDRLHRRRRRLRCPCNRLLHVVQRESPSFPFLRRNPNQRSGPPECELCRSAEDGANTVQAARDQIKASDIRLILATRRHPRESEKQKDTPTDPEHSGQSQKYRRAFGVLFRLLEEARFNRLTEELEWEEMWRRLQAPLRAARTHAGSHRSIADFSWMPGRLYTGGLRDLNVRLLDNWTHPEVQAEGWAFAILADAPEGEEVHFSPLSSAQRQAAASTYPPYKLTIPRHSQAAIGRTGPYLALAVSSANTKDERKFAKPIFHRLLLQSIVSEKIPCPVESQFEREATELLIHHRFTYVKPLFPNPENLRPDFVLPADRTIIEVQGMEAVEYRRAKEEIHRRLTASRAYAGYRLLTYRANDGETLSEFADKLLAIKRG